MKKPAKKISKKKKPATQKVATRTTPRKSNEEPKVTAFGKKLLSKPAPVVAPVQRSLAEIVPAAIKMPDGTTYKPLPDGTVVFISDPPNPPTRGILCRHDGGRPVVNFAKSKDGVFLGGFGTGKGKKLYPVDIIGPVHGSPYVQMATAIQGAVPKTATKDELDRAAKGSKPMSAEKRLSRGEGVLASELIAEREAKRIAKGGKPTPTMTDEEIDRALKMTSPDGRAEIAAKGDVVDPHKTLAKMARPAPVVAPPQEDESAEPIRCALLLKGCTQSFVGRTPSGWFTMIPIGSTTPVVYCPPHAETGRRIFHEMGEAERPRETIRQREVREAKERAMSRVPTESELAEREARRKKLDAAQAAADAVDAAARNAAHSIGSRPLAVAYASQVPAPLTDAPALAYDKTMATIDRAIDKAKAASAVEDVPELVDSSEPEERAPWE